MKLKNDLYRNITLRIIQQLEQGVGAWKQPWQDEINSTVPDEETVVLLNTCDAIIEAMPSRPRIRHDEEGVFYNEHYEYISMPWLEHFTNYQDYYLTLFHFLIASTGAEWRLNTAYELRKNTPRKYFRSREGLIAELGTCYLATHAGIEFDSLQNNVASIQQYLQWLRKDANYILRQSVYAEKAVDYILNVEVVESKVVQLENSAF